MDLEDFDQDPPKPRRNSHPKRNPSELVAERTKDYLFKLMLAASMKGRGVQSRTDDLSVSPVRIAQAMCVSVSLARTVVSRLEREGFLEKPEGLEDLKKTDKYGRNAIHSFRGHYIIWSGKEWREIPYEDYSRIVGWGNSSVSKKKEKAALAASREMDEMGPDSARWKIEPLKTQEYGRERDLLPKGKEGKDLQLVKTCMVCKGEIKKRVVSGRRRYHHPPKECNKNIVTGIMEK
jgi:hypothetical protein